LYSILDRTRCALTHSNILQLARCDSWVRTIDGLPASHHTIDTACVLVGWPMRCAEVLPAAAPAHESLHSFQLLAATLHPTTDDCCTRRALTGATSAPLTRAGMILILVTTIVIMCALAGAACGNNGGS
jgi:hypothetical protein